MGGSRPQAHTHGCGKLSQRQCVMLTAKLSHGPRYKVTGSGTSVSCKKMQDASSCHVLKKILPFYTPVLSI